jgi:hypothetical protein
LWAKLGLEDNAIVKGHKGGEKKLKKLIEEFREIFTRPGMSVGKAPSEFEFGIETKTDKPIRQRVRPTHPLVQQELDAQLNDWLEEGVIQPSNSPWASPLVPVKKKNGSTRFCVDFRLLNAVTIADAFPLPRIEDLLLGMGGAAIFSSLDAASAYHAISVRPEDRQKTAFICSRGLFEFLRLPFGLKNAGPHYSRMAAAMSDRTKNASVRMYMDDQAIATATFDEHVTALRSVFEAHQFFGVLINPEKTLLFQESIVFLGFRVEKGGIFPTDDWMAKIRNWPQPQTPKDLASFIGFIGYYATFLPNFASLVSSLNAAKTGKQLIWTEELNGDFLAIKKEFEKCNGRHHLVLDPETHTYQDLVMDIDFSKTAIAAVLMQRQNGDLRFIAAKSRKLKTYEKRYHSSKGELSALVFVQAREQCHHLQVVGLPGNFQLFGGACPWAPTHPGGYALEVAGWGRGRRQGHPGGDRRAHQPRRGGQGEGVLREFWATCQICPSPARRRRFVESTEDRCRFKHSVRNPDGTAEFLN